MPDTLGITEDCCNPEWHVSTMAEERAHGKDFRLMYVLQFSAEVRGDISETVLKGNYGQLVGYVRGCLEQ